MMKTLKTIALSAMIALGAAGGLTAMTSSANAGGGFYIGGSGHGGHFGLYFGDGYGRHGGYDRGHRHGHGHGWDRRGHCPTGLAVHKARRMGLHRAHVRFRNHRVVAVAGRMHGHRETFLFANDRFCPRIR